MVFNKACSVVPIFQEAVRNKSKFAKGNQVHQGVGEMFVVIWRRVQQNLATQMGLLWRAGITSLSMSFIPKASGYGLEISVNGVGKWDYCFVE